jgi:hypothetical protein
MRNSILVASFKLGVNSHASLHPYGSRIGEALVPNNVDSGPQMAHAGHAITAVVCKNGLDARQGQIVFLCAR